MDAYEKLHSLMMTACDSENLVAERRTFPNSVVVTVEVVNGVPTYFINDNEVTASEAVKALEVR